MKSAIKSTVNLAVCGGLCLLLGATIIALINLGIFVAHVWF